jgi:hypothetical protein
MRFPRLVSWSWYTAAVNALTTQYVGSPCILLDKIRRQAAQINSLLRANLALKLALSRKHADCESLKRLLPADVLAAWKAGRK